MRLLLSALTAAVVAFSFSAPARAAEPTAEEIVQQALGKGAVGFRQGTATLKMTITSATGESKERTLEVKAMRGEDKMLKSLVKFTKPAEVAGTSFLVVEKKDALPDQYVYVPRAKVVRRIAAGNASSTFFGSDFTYGDLMPLPMSEADKIAIVKKPDGDVGGQAVYVLEVTPKIQGAPYGRLIAHVHKKLLVPLKIEFFDPQNKPLKTLNVKKLEKVLVCPEADRKKAGCEEHIPIEVEMKAATGAKTGLVIEKIDPNAKMNEADFTEEAMQR